MPIRFCDHVPKATRTAAQCRNARPNAPTLERPKPAPAQTEPITAESAHARDYRQEEDWTQIFMDDRYGKIIAGWLNTNEKCPEEVHNELIRCAERLLVKHEYQAHLKACYALYILFHGEAHYRRVALAISQLDPRSHELSLKPVASQIIGQLHTKALTRYASSLLITMGEKDSTLVEAVALVLQKRHLSYDKFLIKALRKDPTNLLLPIYRCSMPAFEEHQREECQRILDSITDPSIVGGLLQTRINDATQTGDIPKAIQLHEQSEQMGHSDYRRWLHHLYLLDPAKNPRVTRDISEIIIKKYLDYLNSSHLLLRLGQNMEGYFPFLNKREKEKSTKLAISAYQQALALDPTNELAYVELSRTLTGCNRRDEAIAWLEQATNYHLASGRIWLALARTYKPLTEAQHKFVSACETALNDKLANPEDYYAARQQAQIDKTNHDFRALTTPIICSDLCRLCQTLKHRRGKNPAIPAEIIPPAKGLWLNNSVVWAATDPKCQKTNSTKLAFKNNFQGDYVGDVEDGRTVITQNHCYVISPHAYVRPPRLAKISAIGHIPDCHICRPEYDEYLDLQEFLNTKITEHTTLFQLINDLNVNGYEAFLRLPLGTVTPDPTDIIKIVTDAPQGLIHNIASASEIIEADPHTLLRPIILTNMSTTAVLCDQFHVHEHAWNKRVAVNIGLKDLVGGALGEHFYAEALYYCPDRNIIIDPTRRAKIHRKDRISEQIQPDQYFIERDEFTFIPSALTLLEKNTTPGSPEALALRDEILHRMLDPCMFCHQIERCQDLIPVAVRTDFWRKLERGFQALHLEFRHSLTVSRALAQCSMRALRAHRLENTQIAWDYSLEYAFMLMEKHAGIPKSNCWFSVSPDYKMLNLGTNSDSVSPAALTEISQTFGAATGLTISYS